MKLKGGASRGLIGLRKIFYVFLSVLLVCVIVLQIYVVWQVSDMFSYTKTVVTQLSEANVSIEDYDWEIKPYTVSTYLVILNATLYNSGIYSATDVSISAKLISYHLVKNESWVIGDVHGRSFYKAVGLTSIVNETISLVLVSVEGWH